MGHSYDRAGDWVYHFFLLLGSHSVHWQRRLGIKSWRCGSRRISPSCRSCCDTTKLRNHRQSNICVEPKSQLTIEPTMSDIHAQYEPVAWWFTRRQLGRELRNCYQVPEELSARLLALIGELDGKTEVSLSTSTN